MGKEMYRPGPQKKGSPSGPVPLLDYPCKVNTFKLASWISNWRNRTPHGWELTIDREACHRKSRSRLILFLGECIFLSWSNGLPFYCNCNRKKGLGIRWARRQMALFPNWLKKNSLAQWLTKGLTLRLLEKKLLGNRSRLDEMPIRNSQL